MSHLHPSTLIFFFFLAITSFTTSHLLSRDLETPIRSIRRLFPEITLFTTSFSFNQHTCRSPRRLQHRVSGQISSFGTQQRAVKRGYIRRENRDVSRRSFTRAGIDENNNVQGDEKRIDQGGETMASARR